MFSQVLPRKGWNHKGILTLQATIFSDFFQAKGSWHCRLRRFGQTPSNDCTQSNLAAKYEQPKPGSPSILLLATQNPKVAKSHSIAELWSPIDDSCWSSNEFPWKLDDGETLNKHRMEICGCNTPQQNGLKKLGHLQNGSPRTEMATKLPVVHAQEIAGTLKFLPYKIGVSNFRADIATDLTDWFLCALLYRNISARVILRQNVERLMLRMALSSISKIAKW